MFPGGGTRRFYDNLRHAGVRKPFRQSREQGLFHQSQLCGPRTRVALNLQGAITKAHGRGMPGDIITHNVGPVLGKVSPG
jgi:hypothetical protein